MGVVAEIAKLATAVFLALTAAAGLLAVLGPWVGRFVVDKLLEKDRARYQRELEALKSTLEKETQRLQGEIDTRLIIHRAQFETEFEALKDIWKKVAALRGTMAAVRPWGGTVPRNETGHQKEERQKQTYQAFANALAEAKVTVDDQSPFVPEEVDEILNQILESATLEDLSRN